MQGYDVLTSDDEKVGHVVGETDGNLIVEHGSIFKSKHPLPRAFAHVNEEEQVVRTTISKQIFAESPKIGDDGDVDEEEIARYYGLAAGEENPETQGYGEVIPDDPARTAADDARSAGLPTAEEQRLETRKAMSEGDAQPFSPGATGGDRARDFG